MPILVVVLYLTTWNCDTGLLLSEGRFEIGAPSIGIPYAMKECLETGVFMAHDLKDKAVESPKGGGHITYMVEASDSNISTNVDCQWERGSI